MSDLDILPSLQERRHAAIGQQPSLPFMVMMVPGNLKRNKVSDLERCPHMVLSNKIDVCASMLPLHGMILQGHNFYISVRFRV